MLFYPNMKNYLLLILLILSIGLRAQQPISSGQVVKYSHFTLSYNEDYEQPEWVYYMLTKTDLSKKIARSNNFREDYNILTGSATSKDYSSTGFDRGHMSPASDNQDTLSNSESFLMSNMSPQLPTFNRGIWNELEIWVRQQAIAYDTIYVATGPVFVNCLGHAGNVIIPGYYYKCLLRYDKDKVYTIAFLLPHIGAVGNIEDYIVPVNTIETLTGIDFFPGTNNFIENQLEIKQWKR